VPGQATQQQQQQQQSMQLHPEMIEISSRRDDDTSGQFWQSLFGPPASPLPPHQYSQNFPNALFPHPTTPGGNSSPGHAMGEFSDPNDVNMDVVGDYTGGNKFGRN
jgi:hypothetical protein